MDQKNKRREDDWNKNILSKAELKDSNLYRNHPEYSSMSKSESGSGEVVFVRGFKQQNSKTTFDILKRLKKISDMTEGCNPYNIVTPIAKSKGEPDFYIVRHLSSMGEFDEDDLFDNKICNVGEIFQKELSKEERDNFKKMVWDVAKEDGILQEVGKKNAEDVFNIINDFIFNFNEEKTEQLFAFKLALFELDKVKKGSNESKSAIRKSKSPQEALMAVFSIK